MNATLLVIVLLASLMLTAVTGAALYLTVGRRSQTQVPVSSPNTTTSGELHPPTHTPYSPSQCVALASQYGVVPRQTWGSMPSDIQKLWDMSSCNDAIILTTTRTTTTEAPPPNTVDKAQCTSWAAQYGVLPNQSWGSMPGNLQVVWVASGCDGYAGSTTPQGTVPLVVTDPATTVQVKTSQLTTGTVPKEAFGANLSNVSFSEPNVGSNPAFISAMKALNWPFLRYNGAESFMGAVFPSRSSSPDWGWVDQFNVLPQFFSGTFMLDTGIPAPWMDPNNGSDIQLFCQQVAQVATRLKNNGITVDYFEIMNEPELHNITMASAASALVGCAPLLKGIFPNCKVGGPAMAWANAGNFSPYASQVKTAADFYTYHYYATGDAGFPADSAYQSALGQKGNAAGAVSAIQNSNSGSPFGLHLTEYNISFAWDPPNPLQLQGENAVFTALTVFQSIAGGVTAASIWDSYADSNFGVISGDFSNIYPAGYVLSKLAATAPGTIVSITVGSRLNKLYVVATKPVSGGIVTIVLINYDTANSSQLQIAIDINITQFSRWEVSNANPRGATTTQSISNPVSVPSSSVVILTA